MLDWSRTLECGRDAISFCHWYMSSIPHYMYHGLTTKVTVFTMRRNSASGNDRGDVQSHLGAEGHHCAQASTKHENTISIADPRGPTHKPNLVLAFTANQQDQ